MITRRQQTTATTTMPATLPRKNGKRQFGEPNFKVYEDDDYDDNDEGSATAKKARGSVELHAQDLPPFVTAVELHAQDLPPFVTVGSIFQVCLMCTNDDGALSAMPVVLGEPRLVYADTGLAAAPGLLEVCASPVLSGGRASFRARLLALSRDQEGRAFVIEVPATREIDGTALAPARTTAVTAVAYKLTAAFQRPMPVGASDDPTIVWYNQRGGASNCLCLTVHITDDAGRRDLFAPDVRLKLTLVHADDGTEVRKQDILTVQSDAGDLVAVKGEATVKFRIGEVCRRHEGRFFAVRVSADISADPMRGDVAPVTSDPIDVRSKPSPKALLHAPLQGGFHQHHVEAFPYSPRFSSAASSSLPSSSAMVAGDGEDSSDYALGGGGPSAPPLNSSYPLQPSQPPELVGAFHRLLTWVDEALCALQASKWTPLGYDLAGGAQQPLFSMSNPNERINRAINSYQSQAMHDLCVIKRTVEPIAESHYQRHLLQGGASGGAVVCEDDDGSDVPTGPAPPPRPRPEMQRFGSLNLDLLEEAARPTGSWSRESSAGGLALTADEVKQAFENGELDVPVPSPACGATTFGEAGVAGVCGQLATPGAASRAFSAEVRSGDSPATAV